MRKYEAERQAQDCVTLLTDHEEGGWGFRYRQSPESPWHTSPPMPRAEAIKLRRAHLVRHARRLLGKPEDYKEGKRNWIENL